MKLENIIIEKEEGVAKITLNRPRMMNALTLQTFEELREVIEDIRTDRSIRTVSITGAGQAFCAGLDLSVMEAISSQSSAEFREGLRRFQDVFNSILIDFLDNKFGAFFIFRQ